MDNVQYFLWLLDQTVNHSVFLWPAGVLLLLAAIAATRSDSHDLLRARVFKLSLPALIPLLIMVLGTSYVRPSDSLYSPGWAALSVSGLWLLQLLISAYFIRSFKEIRFFAAALCLFHCWLTCLAAFVAHMSISGVWL